MNDASNAASKVPFVLVDVFAGRPLAGNPVSVVPDADGLPVGTMRAIAREFNQSETTFVLGASDGRADVRFRSFTPTGEEVGGAGHNIVGAWIWLASAGRLPVGQESFVQEIGDDLLRVRVARAGGAAVPGAAVPGAAGPGSAGGVEVTMTQLAPVAGGVLPAGARGGLAGALGIRAADLAESSPRVISTGAGHLLTEVRSRDVVDRVSPDSRRLADALRAVGAEGCYVYTLEAGTQEERVAPYARFFNPIMGIPEDPATGTAAGPLAARLVEEGVLAPGAAVEIEQGTALGRRSLIRVRALPDGVELTGSGVVSAEGVLHLWADQV
ncbi:PhzF family phenazine biosynthesis protein [Promicromonospora sp. CA-289599]|uniref:PhzF family phenazine biosynthesis protein n=1 Tax=Promicromonospora sp. CA-289599 TaxID=3240014 RepID=UPI003D8B055D